MSLQVIDIIAGGSAGAAALCAPSTTYYPGRRLLARLAPVLGPDLNPLIAQYAMSHAGMGKNEGLEA